MEVFWTSEPCLYTNIRHEDCVTTVCHEYEDFCGEKALWGTPGNSWWGYLQILTHFRQKNVVFHTRFQTWPLRNSVIITVMIRFSAFLPISAPFRISNPLSSVFLLISAPSLLGAPLPTSAWTVCSVCPMWTVHRACLQGERVTLVLGLP